MYSGCMFANNMLLSIASTILNPNPSQAIELTMPEVPGTLKDLKCYPLEL